MDRSMKVMFGMMTVAICLLAITMMNAQSQQAYAGEYVGDRDRGTEPTIVSFRVTPIQAAARFQLGPSENQTTNTGMGLTCGVLLTRMWSDGSVEVNFVGDETLPDPSGYGSQYSYALGNIVPQPFDGWITVTDSVAGYACVGDVDGNRIVDPNDLMAVLKNWGQCEQDPPLGLPDDPDLM